MGHSHRVHCSPKWIRPRHLRPQSGLWSRITVEAHRPQSKPLRPLSRRCITTAMSWYLPFNHTFVFMFPLFQQELPASTPFYVFKLTLWWCHPLPPPPTGVGLQSSVPALARGRVDASLKKNISSYLHIPLA